MNHTLIVVLAALWVGLIKGGLGPMAGALLVPILSLVMPVTDAAALTLPMFLVGDWATLPFFWRRWDTPALRLLLPSGVVGALLGVVLLAALPNDVLRPTLGVLSLVVAIYKITSDRLRTLAYQPRRWHGWLAGSGSGLGSALANVGGPPITAYLLLLRTEPAIFIGTTAVFFLVINALKVPAYLAAGLLDFEGLRDVAWTLPLIPLGVWAGKRALDRIHPRHFEWLTLIMLVVVGVLLLVA